MDTVGVTVTQCMAPKMHRKGKPTEFMSANLIDLFTARASARETAIIDGTFRPERRRRARTQVHWSVLLRPRNGDVIETVTQNLSSSGFYCFCPMPLAAGESLVCTLKVPVYDPKGDERPLALECTVVVMRSEAAGEGFCGIACRIEDYHLLARGPRPA